MYTTLARNIIDLLVSESESLVLCGPGSAQKPGLGPGLEGSGPRKRLSRALSPQAGPAQAGLGSGPGFVGAVRDRNECFKNNLSEL